MEIQTTIKKLKAIEMKQAQRNALLVYRAGELGIDKAL